jgi:Fis family transcriptional regulator
MSTHLPKHTPVPLPPAERRKQPLSNAVKIALDVYLTHLGDHEPDSLYRMVIEEVERPMLECIMNYSGGNQTKAARYLGLNRGTLRKKLKLHGLE